MNINGREIGSGSPCYIVAEMSANHGGSFKKALALVHAAKKAGADAIKLQTYTPDTMTIDCDNEYFRLDHPLWKGKTLYQLYGETQTPWEWHKPLKEEAERLGLHFISTPFDETAVDFLETLNVSAYKIASFELVDDVLLRKISRTRKPVIMSTGMATLNEITHAVDVLRSNGTKQLALLRCVSSYPAKTGEINLSLIENMRKRFNVVVGLSDHTTNSVAAIAAVVLGADIVEKHIKLSDDDITPDAVFSLSVLQFQKMVRDISLAKESIGQVVYGVTNGESTGLCFRRSIIVVKEMKKGEKFSENNLRVLRPGYGMSPMHLNKILGKIASRDIVRGSPLKEEMIDEQD